MSKEGKVKKNVVKSSAFEAIRTLYYSGKVKPSLNKIAVELEEDPENVDLLALGCQCMLRAKHYDEMSAYADSILELAPENASGYYYKGVAFQNTKGKEQEALKNFTKALDLDEDNTVYLKSKATTHFLLYTDYDLPIKFAEKHRAKAEEILLKVIELVEQKENPSYTNFLTAGDVSTMLNQNLDAKKYYIRAVNAFEEADESVQDKNTYKDIIKAQKACVKLLEKFTE
ncbi:hypothetical protein BFP72_18100 [Reichenbachiella sp. 5M10]|uniref:tetratricopeptide repeat protein n=1 Tax=Reichenbachiella sp. 5M10 TaxID=1889772 RepID=UPI000C160AAF|nr:hypothetical protein [Reichenbachiella sp. 5M10]PIB37182.1 hypothetical protein BFP72_18100 [Reichenbachiella sp. 5M10]